MKKRNQSLWLLPTAAGAFLTTALIWAGWLVRPEAEETSSFADREPVAPLPAPPAVAARELPGRAPGQRTVWPPAQDDAPGLFDSRPGRPFATAALPNFRRWEVELVATRELPFRLQLIGHFGEGSNLSGIFEAEGVAGSLLARGGEELTEFGLAVRALELESGPPEGGPARAIARIWDGWSGRELVLPESVRIKSGVGAALLAPAGYPGEAIELLAGEIVEVDEDEFRVERIGLSPASATLRRLATAVGNEGDEELFLQVEGGPES
jgi:hypothetical protein